MAQCAIEEFGLVIELLILCQFKGVIIDNKAIEYPGLSYFIRWDKMPSSFFIVRVITLVDERVIFRIFVELPRIVLE